MTRIAVIPEQAQLQPGKKQSFIAKGYDQFGNDYEITGVCPICGGYSFYERKGVVKIADAIVKPKYLLLLCELAKATDGRVLLLNRGDAERQRLYFQIGEDIEMIIMQVHPSVARQEELLFELKID